jgi:hypothetical protein
LSRLDKERDSEEKKKAIASCERTLLSQLLIERMRDTFVRSYLNQLSVGERRILDRFLARVSPPPDAEVANRLDRAFLAIPWKVEFTRWQRSQAQPSCEIFRGKSYLTRADDLWCVKCTSNAGGLQQELFFYPDAAGKACTLQMIWFSHPTASSSAVTVTTERLVQHLGHGRPQSRVHGPGAAYWEEISSWNTNGREVLIFRNVLDSQAGEGLPRVDIIAKDQELLSVIQQEEATEREIENESQRQEEEKRKRLYGDAAKSLPDVIRNLEKADGAESHYRVLRDLLPRIARRGSERSVQLYLADWLARKLAQAADLGQLTDWEKKEQALSAYGLSYTPSTDGVFYSHVFLERIVDEGLTGYWAEEAFLAWLLLGGKLSCQEPDGSKWVIAKGEEFLRKNTRSHIRQRLLLTLAQAHETSWSLTRIIHEDFVFAHNRPLERGSRSGGFRRGAHAPCSRLTRANPERSPANAGRSRSPEGG